MTKYILRSVVAASFASLMLTACEDDTKKAEVVVPEPVSKSFSEEFEDCSSLSGKGWVIINNSNPVGPTAWRQGKYEVRTDSKLGQYVDGFPAYSAQKSPNDFISCDMDAGQNQSTLSAWLISPAKTMKNGDQIVFYTRARGERCDALGCYDYADRLQVRGNFTTATANCGKSATDVGDFTTPLLEINAAQGATTYPRTWTKQTITLSGLPAGEITGRIAFRYFVTGGGPAGTSSDMIGIDAFEFISK